MKRILYQYKPTAEAAMKPRGLEAQLQRYSGAAMDIAPQEAVLFRSWGSARVTVSLAGSHGVAEVIGAMSYDPDWDEIPYEAVATAARILKAAPEVRTAELRVTSPGGTVMGSKAATEEWIALAKAKHTKVWVPALAASAAYRLATATALGKNLYAAPGARVGSVATHFLRVDVTEMLKQRGIKYSHYSGAATQKLWGDSTVPLSEEEDAALAAEADRSTKAFQAEIAGYGYKSAQFWADAKGAVLEAAPGLVNFITKEINVDPEEKEKAAKEQAAKELTERMDRMEKALQAAEKGRQDAEAALAFEKALNQAKELQRDKKIAEKEEALQVVAKAIQAAGTDWLQYLAAAPEQREGAAAPKVPPPPDGGGHKETPRKEIRERAAKGDLSFLDDNTI